MAKELNEAVVFAVSMAVAIDEQLVDGFQWTDIFGMIPAFTKLPAAVAGADQIDEELENWTDQDQAELIVEIDKLNLESDFSEELGKQGAKLCLELGKMIVLVRKARKKDV